MSCIKHSPTNNQPSILYQQILDKLASSETEADILYAYFSQDSFKSKFGNYIGEYRAGLTNERVDENGEPLLTEVDGSFYFTAKDGTRVQFPQATNKLQSLINYKTLSEAVSTMATNYLVEDSGLNMGNLNISETGIGSLKNYIEEKLRNRLAHIESEIRNGNRGMVRDRLAINNLLKHTDEYIGLIKNYYEALGLNFKEVAEDTDNIEMLSDAPKDYHFGKSSFETDPGSNVRAAVKLRLAMIPDNSGKVNVLGIQNYIPYDTVFRDLLNNWTEIYQYEVPGTNASENVVLSDVFLEMKDRLKKLIRFKPQYQSLLDFISDPNTDENIKVEIFNAFNLQVNKYLATNMKTKGGVMKVSNKNISSTNDKSSSLRRELDSNFINKHIIADIETTEEAVTIGKNKDSENATGEIVEGVAVNLKEKAVENIKAVINELNELTSFLRDTRIDSAKTSLNHTFEGYEGTIRDVFIDKFNDFFENTFGTRLNPEALDYYLSINDTDGLGERNLAITLLNRLKKDIGGIAKPDNNALKNIIVNGIKDLRVISKSAVIKELMEADVLFKESDDTASVRTNAGTAYSYQNKNHLNVQIAVWRQNPEILRTLRDNNPWLKNSAWINYLLAEDIVDKNLRKSASKTRLQEFDVRVMVDAFVTKNDKTEGMSAKDMDKDLYMLDYITKVLKADTSGRYTVRTITPADKSQDLQLSIKFSLNNTYQKFEGKVIKLSDQTRNQFIQYFTNDVARIAKAEKKRNDLELAYQRGLEHFNNQPAEKRNYKESFSDYLAQENELVVHYDYKKGTRSKYDAEKGEFIKGDYTKGNAFRSQLFPALSFDFTDFSRFKNPRQHIDKASQVKEMIYDKDGNLASWIYDADGIITTKTVSENGLNIYDAIGEYIDMSLTESILATRDRMYNDGFLKNKEVIDQFDQKSQAVEGMIDTSILEKYNSRFKNKEGEAGLALASDFFINATLRNIEYAKLFTGDIAYYKNIVDFKKRIPETYTDGIVPISKKTHFKVATISSVEVKQYLNKKKLIDALGEQVANMFDGTNSADAQAWITPQRWKELKQGMSWTPAHEEVYRKMMSGVNEVYTSEELKIIAQPLKGVYFWRGQDGRPTFLKYSQAVLTPRLVAGTPLQEVYNKMADPKNGFDELVTLDGIKVGALNPTTIHNADGTAISPDKLEFNVHSLDVRGWKLQQDLPTKTFKDTELGSQIQKNIYFAIKNNPDMELEVDGKMLTGREIMTQLTNVFRNMSDAGMIKLFKEFGFNENGMITNVDRFYSMLIDELRSRNGSLSMIDALEKRMNLASMPQLRGKIDSMFASIINKRIVKIKTNGGSFIQMSNFGMNNIEAVSNGVLLHPALAAYTKMYDEQGNPILNEEGVQKSTMNTFEPYVYDVTLDNSLKISDLTQSEYNQLNVDKYLKDIVDNEELFKRFTDQLADKGKLKIEC